MYARRALLVELFVAAALAACSGSGQKNTTGGSGGQTGDAGVVDGGGGASNDGGSDAAGDGDAAAATPGPVAFWASQPVAPGESVLVTAGKIGASSALDIARLPDDPAGDPTATPAPPALTWTPALVDAASSRSLAAVVPAAFTMGVYAIRLHTGSEDGPTRLVNAPDPWFVEGDHGDSTAPGGKLIVAGTCLSITGATPRAVLVQGGAVAAELVASGTHAGGGYALDWTVPATVAPGDYELWLHNGTGGPSAWVRYTNFDTQPVTTVTVATPVTWPATVADVSKQTGATADDRFTAAIASLKTAGGGVLYVPAGTYHLTGQLMLPAHTVLRGAGMGMTTLVWDVIPTREYDGQQMAWVDQGHDVPLVRSWFVTWGMPDRVTFAVEDIGIQAPPGYGASGNVNATALSREFVSEFGWIRRVGVTVAPVAATATTVLPLPAIWLRQARNTEITGCTLSANTAVFGRDAVSFTRIEQNTLHWTQGVVWLSSGSTANVISGNTFDQVGDSTSNGWAKQANPNPGITYSAFYASATCPPYTKDTLFSGNLTTRQAAEVPPAYVGYTSDGSNGVYLGGVTATSGATMTLASASTGTFDFAGGVVEVLDGAGAGQWRTVVALPAGGTSLTVDRPWDVALDATSVVTVVTRQGRLLMMDNDFSQFPLLQDYYLSGDSIKAHNKLGVAGATTAVNAWAGLHYSGTMPAWHTQVLENQAMLGTGVKYRSFIGVATPAYPGTVAAAHVYRNATSPITEALSIGSTTGPFADALIEDNQLDTIQFANGTQTYALRGVVVVRGNHTLANGASALQPAMPAGVTVAP